MVPAETGPIIGLEKFFVCSEGKAIGALLFRYLSNK
jgi:hypothetical protein